MDLEKVGRQNWLEIWRKRKGLSSETVDKILSVPSGWTQKYEALGIMRVPGFLLADHARQTFLKIMEFHYKGVQNLRERLGLNSKVSSQQFSSA